MSNSRAARLTCFKMNAAMHFVADFIIENNVEVLPLSNYPMSL